MKTTGKAIIVVGSILITSVVMAQFPALPVIDVAAVPQWAVKLANDITMIEKAATTILRIESVVHNLEYQAQYLSNIGSSWGWLSHPWTPAYFNDSTGLNTGWIGAINSDLNTVNAYTQLVATLDGDLLYNPGAFSPDFQRSIAMIERMDGHATQSTSIVGQYSVANIDYQRRLGNLTTSIYSQNPDDNTAAAQAQKTNSGLMLLLENTNMSSELARKSLEQQTEMMILERERGAKQLNSEAHFQQHAADLLGGTVDDSLSISTQ